MVGGRLEVTIRVLTPLNILVVVHSNTKKVMFLGWLLFTFVTVNPVSAQSGGHASVGLGHGEEGYLHLEEMVKLPGVGRKTANVVLGNVYNIPSVVVDTHVTRITNLLKFVKTRNAEKIERGLMKIINQNNWTLFAHLLIDHGRLVCVANRPKCGECIISELCPSNKGDH